MADMRPSWVWESTHRSNLEPSSLPSAGAAVAGAPIDACDMQGICRRFTKPDPGRPLELYLGSCPDDACDMQP